MPIPPPSVQIKADDATLRGVYANTMMVSHTKEEFVMDYMSILPPQGALVSRVVTSPGHIKRIITALSENLAKYERDFGTVTPAQAPDHAIGFKAQ